MDLACGCSLLTTTHDLKQKQINYRYEARLKTLINAMQSDSKLLQIPFP